MNAITQRILLEKDDKYREFCIKLTPSVAPSRVLGVRIPALRKIAKNADADSARAFLRALPHDYYEEDNVHGFLIERIQNYGECVAALDEFLKHVDNWATCDMCSPKILKKYPEKTVENAFRWIDSGRVYESRFGIKALMSFFQDELYEPRLSDKVASVKSGEYYVNMMIAWYFATLLSKQWDFAIKYLQNNALDEWTHNKTIRKAIESYRISDEKKDFLRKLTVRGK